MPILSKLQALLEDPRVKLLVNLREAAALVLAYFAFARAPFTKPDLDVTYFERSLTTPASITATLDSLIGLNPSTRVDSAILLSVQRVNDFIRSSDYKIIDLSNNSSDPIEDINLEARGFTSISAVNVDATSSRIDPNAMTAYKLNGTTATFPTIKALPSSAKVTVEIWGETEPSYLTDVVDVKAQNASVRIKPVLAASPFAVFLDRNLGSIVILALGVTLLIGLYRMKATK
jgi:hypothetical protein